ncbi:phosphatase PAP2 family protein [Sphaerisporangium sp. NPDC051011]|uniref:phosphatase PAP2 family protein n=1 Tax=Sphaerisporangium sp. NPDC051011 TaxID=3155792 RepID=UPI003411C4B3
MNAVRLLVSVLLLSLASLLGFAARTPGWTARDAALGQAIQSVRTPWLTVVARALDIGFNPVVGTVAVAGLVAALVFTGRRRAAWRTTAVVLAGWGVSAILKIAIGRPRPPVAHALLGELGDNSFPSGHVCLTLSMAIAVALLARRTRHFRAVVVGGGLVVVAQMLARVYLGAHYPADTVGSIIATPAAAYLGLSLERLRALGVLELRATNRHRARTATPPATSDVAVRRAEQGADGFVGGQMTSAVKDRAGIRQQSPDRAPRTTLSRTKASFGDEKRLSPSGSRKPPSD